MRLSDRLQNPVLSRQALDLETRLDEARRERDEADARREIAESLCDQAQSRASLAEADALELRAWRAVAAWLFDDDARLISGWRGALRTHYDNSLPVDEFEHSITDLADALGLDLRKS